MTIIAALETEEGTIFGADSAGSTSDFICGYRQRKIFRNGRYAFGVSGSFRMMQIIQNAKLPDDDFEILSFARMIRELLRDEGLISDGGDLPGTILFSHMGRLHELQGDFSILRPSSGYSAIGSGSPYAFGALFASDGMDGKKRIQMALKAACKFDPSAMGPFQYLVDPK